MGGIGIIVRYEPFPMGITTGQALAQCVSSKESPPSRGKVSLFPLCHQNVEACLSAVCSGENGAGSYRARGSSAVGGSRTMIPESKEMK